MPPLFDFRVALNSIATHSLNFDVVFFEIFF
nr:MAG TPA: hypothetical protein [Caudoviricetes sp.]